MEDARTMKHPVVSTPSPDAFASDDRHSHLKYLQTSDLRAHGDRDDDSRSECATGRNGGPLAID
jgi:hypothetical protein